MSDNKETHLYRHYDENGALLYVGVSLSAFARLAQHKEHSHWFKRIVNMKIESFPTREEALHAETMAIMNERPEFNIAKKQLAKRLEAELRKQEERKLHAKDREKLTHKLVQFNPLYSTQEAANILGLQEWYLKSLIENKKLGGVLFYEKERKTRWGTTTIRKYGVTGWQLIEFIETIEREGKLPA